jgi:glycosyltransferase involved in cell wall biosynthesis
MLISLIVTTYNRPDALVAVLAGLLAQDDPAFEVLIADDGSRDDTSRLVDAFSASAPVAVRHVWHEDLGFRVAAIRNRAAALAAGEYMIFVDGDCVPLPDFVTQHRALAEPGWMVAGNRLLLSEAFTRRVLGEGLPIEQWPLGNWIAARRRGDINRVIPLLHLPLGPLRKIGGKRWQRVRGCNMGVWRRDLETVNGFDESFHGWGFEDSDFAVRLINSGVRVKKGTFATGLLHLWHRENDRRREGENWRRLQQRIASGETRASRGLDRQG